MRVLLADDSALILERLKEMLGIYKQVEIVGSLKNGTDTLEALRTMKPDLAIVDLKMPGLSGIQVLTEIRKEDKLLKFIILTFHPYEYLRQMAIHAGVDHFFSKVDDFERVAHTVAEMIVKEENKSKNY